MSDVTLSASVRQSLLSLQNTTSLVERTQGRLSTGLRVAGAIDDPVAFFQAKSLSDRSSDFLEKKDAIDQGISTVTAALDGVEAIEALVKQMKGIANSMKSATDSQISDLVAQFNDLRSQVDNLAADASYQGTNLINGTGQTLSIEFSERTASLLNITSVDLRTSTAGLDINSVIAVTGDDNATHAAISAVAGGSNTFANRFLSTSADFVITYNAATDTTFSAGETVAFTYGTGSTFNLIVASGSDLTVTAGAALDVDIVTAQTARGTGAEFALVATSTINAQFGYSAQSLTALVSATTAGGAQVTDTLALTYNGTEALTLTTADSSVYFTVGTQSVQLVITSGTIAITGAGDVITIDALESATQASAATTNAYIVVANGTGTTYAITATTSEDTTVYGVAFGGGATQITASDGEFTLTGAVSAGDTTAINSIIDELDTALTTLRTQSQTLGANVALLNTRLDFTEGYVNTLQGGADKLTLADINEEGANLLALQTRQQLGIQSLSLAAQAEASILQLFG